MYNVRYHIASLAAVFLALTVGLVLGSVVAERGSVSGRIDTLVKELQGQFDSLQKENAELRRSLDAERSFGLAAARSLVRDALVGRTVLVVTNAGRADGLDAVRSAVEEAGGSVAVLMIKKPRAGLDEAVPEGITTQTAESGAAIEAVAKALASELATQGERPTLRALTDAGLVSVRGLDAGAIGGCVTIASADGAPDAFGLALAIEFDRLGVASVGAESGSRDTGVAAAASRSGMSAVDHVDTSAGTVSLVWCLAGRAEGRFGMKKGASALHPEL